MKHTQKIHTVVTHHRFHRDEVVAILILLYYGEKKFPGIIDAIKNLSFEFWDAGTETPDGKSWQDWYQRGYLLIGVGGSPYDEHARSVFVEKECAATLVAKDLKVDDLPELQQILRITLNIDTQGSKDPLGFDSLMRAGHRRFERLKIPNHQAAMLEWALQQMQWILDDQILLFTQTKKEFDQFAAYFKVNYKGREIIVIAIQSDDEQIIQYCKFAGKAAVVVHQNSKKHFCISTQGAAKIDLTPIIKLIRIEELRINKTGFKPNDEQLMKEGTYPGTEKWCYHKGLNCIMNGSLSAPTKKPSTIPMQKIVDIVLTSLKEAKGEIRQQQKRA